MIRLERVSKSYRAGGALKVVLDDVSFEFPPGRNIGLLGRNGAGKSTLLRMIAGAVEPDRGVIRREGRISWPLGFTGGLHGALTGVQNARFVARIYGVDTDDLIERVEEFAELGAFVRAPVATYSSGMRARLAFGISMAIDFDLYLIDEVISVGDAAFRRRCAAALASKLGRARIIMVSHLSSIIRQYCDAGMLVEGGRLIWYDDVSEALDAYQETVNRPAPA